MTCLNHFNTLKNISKSLNAFHKNINSQCYTARHFSCSNSKEQEESFFGNLFGEKKEEKEKDIEFAIKGRSLVSLKDFSRDHIQQFVWTALDLKGVGTVLGEGENCNLLEGKVATLVFEKDDITARLSAEIAIKRLGGQVVSYHPLELNDDNIKETACFLGGMSDLVIVGARNVSHIEAMADAQSTPILNMTSDLKDPLQVLAYFLTIQEFYGFLHGAKIAYVGPGNHVLNELLYGCARLGIDLETATPMGYEPDIDAMLFATQLYMKNWKNHGWGSTLNIGHNLMKAVYRADCIITEPWVLPGMPEDEARARRKAFASYHIKRQTLEEAGGAWSSIHRLPYRSGELSDDVMWGEESLSQRAVENRVWATMAVALHILRKYEPLLKKPKFVRGE